MNAGSMRFTGVFNDFGDDLWRFVRGKKQSLTSGEHGVLQSRPGGNKVVNVQAHEWLGVVISRSPDNQFIEGVLDGRVVQMWSEEIRVNSSVGRD